VTALRHALERTGRRPDSNSGLAVVDALDALDAAAARAPLRDITNLPTRAAVEERFRSELEAIEGEGDHAAGMRRLGQRFDRCAVDAHRSDDKWACDAQLRAMAAELQVDVAVVNSADCADGVAVFEARGAAFAHMSWRDYVAPRVVRQRTQGVGAGERPLVVLVWNGSDHYDAALAV
jgi:hypothetical protein